MILFVLTCLSIFVAAFLLMLCIHVIKIEKTVVDAVERIEEKVTRLYSESGS